MGLAGAAASAAACWGPHPSRAALALLRSAPGCCCRELLAGAPASARLGCAAASGALLIMLAPVWWGDRARCVGITDMATQQLGSGGAEARFRRFPREPLFRATPTVLVAWREKPLGGTLAKAAPGAGSFRILVGFSQLRVVEPLHRNKLGRAGPGCGRTAQAPGGDVLFRPMFLRDRAP